MDLYRTLTFNVFVLLTWIKLMTATDIQLVPTQVVLTTQVPPQTSVTCTPAGTSNIKEIISMQIQRKRPEDSNYVALVEVTLNNNPALVDTITQEAPDIENRNPTLTGGIDSNTPSLSTLKMELNTNTITCNDVAEFHCELVYRDTSNNFLTETASSNLTVYALPKDLSMTVTEGGFTVSGGTATNPADFKVGEVVTISCTGKIGSDNSTRIRWRITSELSSTDNFIDYNPPAGTGSESQAGDYAECSYSRTASVNYNMTAADANRQNNLIFQCYISVNPPSQGQYEIPNPPMFYIDVQSGSVYHPDDNVGNKTCDCQKTTSYILVSVICVQLVLLIICLVVIFKSRQLTRKGKKPVESRPAVITNDSTAVSPDYVGYRSNDYQNEGLELANPYESLQTGRNDTPYSQLT